jgi:hypothetical protein
MDLASPVARPIKLLLREDQPHTSLPCADPLVCEPFFVHLFSSSVTADTAVRTIKLLEQLDRSDCLQQQSYEHPSAIVDVFPPQSCNPPSHLQSQLSQQSHSPADPGLVNHSQPSHGQSSTMAGLYIDGISALIGFDDTLGHCANIVTPATVPDSSSSDSEESWLAPYVANPTLAAQARLHRMKLRRIQREKQLARRFENRAKNGAI